MTDVEAVDDVTCEVPNLLKIVAFNGTAFVEHEHHVNTEALGAALFQLTARLDEVVDVASGAVVLLPEVGLSPDVTRDTVVVIASLTQEIEITIASSRHTAYTILIANYAPVTLVLEFLV